MINRNTYKYIMIAAGLIVVGVGGYFLYQYFKLQQAAVTTVDITVATDMLNTATQGLDDTLQPDDVLANADADKGTATTDDVTGLSNEDLLTIYNQWVADGQVGTFDDYLAGN